MARWKLMTAHYLNVEDIDGEKVEFEYSEIDMQTQRRRKRVFPVPFLLDPQDPTVCNDNGIIVVSDGKGSRGPRDYIFFGEPTPDMQPLDEEAQAISTKLQPKWIHAIDSLPSNGDFSQSLISAFTKQMEGLAEKLKPVENTSFKGVDPVEFAKMQEQLAALVARNAELEAKQPERRI